MNHDQPEPEERPSEVLGALPRSRPHRRSSKRTASAATATEPAQSPARRGSRSPSPDRPATRAARKSADRPATPAARKPKPPREKPLRQPPQPRGVPPKSDERARPAPADEPTVAAASGVLGTTVQAAAELAEIGLSASARALRRAVSRLPRP